MLYRVSSLYKLTGDNMKHPINTVLALIEGGNKYRVAEQQPTPGSEFKGCYLLECIDFWCIEDLGDEIECTREGQSIWVASFHADFMLVWQTAESYLEDQSNGNL